MKSRERVIKTLEFDNPDRVPRDLWWLPAIEMFQEEELEALMSKYPMDITAPEIEPGTTAQQRESDLPSYTTYLIKNPFQGKYLDEWGSIWHIGEDGVLGEVKEPVLNDLDKLDDLDPPWEFLETTDLSKVDSQCEKSDKFMLSHDCSRPFERMQFIRGPEKLYKDLVRNREKVIELRDKVHEYNLEHIKMWLETKVDGIFIMDDWGSQNNLLISPDIWREVFKPLYKEYCDLVHKHDKYIFFHSDGYIQDIYGDLIEVGMDAINSQLFVMNIEKLAEMHKGDVTFWGEIDRQRLLPFGEPEEIKKAVYRVRRALEDGSGGVIAQCEWGKNNPAENIETVYEAWSESLEEIK
ncbi:hypothetical protein AKJ62_03435 [candidate division MSBL1 archaeon SCGC-AAA259D14]|uniref:Uroporphyrinogen decarboxylase (URO-D) domain-containing protein n=2 Tax=candidate division MSBL1 TaxID=215777 RepID=A0A133U515_9EURY|nr:hypothetical protein AKJ62_03435 [candidate division MSBL1 archaeon SCGC-AAA259D14]